MQRSNFDKEDQIIMKNSIKEKIFHICVESFNKVMKSNSNDFVCPICLNQFLFEALDSNEITLEHVPPQSMKGRIKLLTCKKCNNILGSKIDSQIAKMINFKKSVHALTSGEGHYEGNALYETDNGKFNTELDINKNLINLTLKRINNNPKSLLKFANNLFKNKSFQISPKIHYNQRLANIGLLKNAYLIAFASFGYYYILSKNLSIVRNQIINFQKNIIDVFTVMQPGKSGYELLKLETPFSCISIRINDIVVILPWIDSKLDFYDKLSNLYKGKNVQFEGYPIMWPNTMEFYLDNQL